MQVCTVVFGKTTLMASGRPFKPSTTAIRMSWQPRFLSSLKTLSQNFEPSVCSIHSPSTSRSPLAVSAGVILTHPVGVNLTHLGNDGGFLATDNVDSGASSGDQGNGASRRQHSGDGQAARLLTQHGQAIPA